MCYIALEAPCTYLILALTQKEDKRIPKVAVLFLYEHTLHYKICHFKQPRNTSLSNQQ